MQNKEKHIPKRRCIGCMESKPQAESRMEQGVPSIPPVQGLEEACTYADLRIA